MKNQIFVKNFPRTLTPEELQRHFAAWGEITQTVIIRDHETQRSRGFGFITFTTDAAALKAIEAMNGQSLEGSCLQVSLARPLVRKSFQPLLKDAVSIT